MKERLSQVQNFDETNSHTEPKQKVRKLMIKSLSPNKTRNIEISHLDKNKFYHLIEWNMQSVIDDTHNVTPRSQSSQATFGQKSNGLRC